MEIKIDENNRQWLIVEHRGKTIPFEVRGYSSNSKMNGIFHDINNFWHWREKGGCTEELDIIFDELNNVSRSLDYLHDLSQTHRLIVESVVKIAECIPVSVVRSWMENGKGEFRSRIVHPSNLKDEIEEGDYVEQTYLKDEYMDLVAYNIAIKVLVPIWGSYLMLLKDIREVDRDIIALGIINRSKFATENAYKRLQLFCECLANKDTSKLSVAGILNAGLSSSIIPEYLLANGIVTKLALSPLSHENDDTQNTKGGPINLIANLFTQLQFKVKQIESKKDHRVRDKALSSDDSGSDEDNLSVGEQYKPKTTLSESTLSTFDYYMEDLVRRAKMVKDDINVDHLKRLYELNISRSSFNPLEQQCEVVGLITVRCGLTPRAVPYTNREGALKLFTIAQVVAHEWGFSSIAELIAGQRRESLASLSSRSMIREEYKQRLEEDYPFSRNYKPESSSKTSTKTPGEIAIIAISNLFIPWTWSTIVTPEIAQLSLLTGQNDRRQCHRDMRNEISEFILKVRSNIN